MANKSTEVRWIIILAGIVFVGILVWSSFRQTQVTYEVCLEFNGRSHCATASGATQAEAERSAKDIDCALVTNGRDELMRCNDVEPTSTRRMK
jgi:hypothetical protein